MAKHPLAYGLLLSLAALLAACGGPERQSGPYLPDMNLLFQEYNRLDSLGNYQQLGALLASENRDLQASELFLAAADSYLKAGQADSAVALLQRAIDAGMANPRILDKLGPIDLPAGHPALSRLYDRLDSIAEALRNVSNFDLEMRSMEAFWPYFDRALADTSGARAQLRAFVLEGPRELRDYYVIRYGSADQMYGQMINAAPGYYRYLQGQFNPDSVRAMKALASAWMQRFQTLYPKAVFPKVYVVPGILNSGGTASEMGMFLGGDMYGKSPGMPTAELNDWQRNSIMEVADLPRLTLHELMHFQQNYQDAEREDTLLAGVIGEGVCDFLAELCSGIPLKNENLRFLEDPENNERIFADLKAELLGTDTSKWLYNGDGVEDRPHDLGYTVGYLITKSYYENQRDKQQAIDALLNTGDFASIVAGSSYAWLLPEPLPAAK